METQVTTEMCTQCGYNEASAYSDSGICGDCNRNNEAKGTDTVTATFDRDTVVTIDTIAQHVCDIANTVQEVGDTKISLQRGKEHMARMERKHLLSGAVDGKNEATRAAQLDALLKEDAFYQHTKEAYQRTEQRLVDAQAKLEYLRGMLPVLYVKAGIQVTVSV